MVAKIFEGQDAVSDDPEDTDSSVSWSDRKKRDRLREKELLSQLKYVPFCALCMNFDGYPSCLTTARFTFQES